MPNTMSAKKALRQSERKKAHNLFWKTRVRGVAKDIRNLLKTKDATMDVLKEKEILLQKYSDKAVKEKVIHKNKANRLKSRYAKKITAHQQSSGKSAKPVAKAAKTKKKVATK